MQLGLLLEADDQTASCLSTIPAESPSAMLPAASQSWPTVR
ncbi:MAG: hypothetical protein R2704_07345 [Microthrixaceae bacterium]